MCYRLMHNETWRKGLNVHEIERTRDQLAVIGDRGAVLSTCAYKPTGLALGCPLPDQRSSVRLARISRLAEEWIASVLNRREAVFARVPADSFHITVLNRTHFDAHATIVSLSPDHKDIATRVCLAEPLNAPVKILMEGLILTHEGKLLVRGYPTNDSLTALKDRLLEALPEFAEHVPLTFHVKLGHLMQPLYGDKLVNFLVWLSKASQYVSFELDFTEIHTPLGTIPLSVGVEADS